MTTNIDSTKTEKLCNGCDKTLPLTEFHKNGTTRHPLCKTCRSEERRNTKNPRKEGTKYCPGCKETHHTSDFNSDKSAPDGLQNYCRKQRHLQQKKYLNTFDGFLQNLFNDLRHNAKKRNILVEITLDDIKELYKKQDGKCALSGRTMTYESKEREDKQHIINKNNISVDRIDSKKGYIKDNIQLVCAIVNRMKMLMTDDELKTIAEKVVNHNQGKINELLKDS